MRDLLSFYKILFFFFLFAGHEGPKSTNYFFFHSLRGRAIFSYTRSTSTALIILHKI